ncbi:hypothetical protein ACUNG1_26195, partial [Serratia sp. IR-2025]
QHGHGAGKARIGLWGILLLQGALALLLALLFLRIQRGSRILNLGCRHQRRRRRTQAHQQETES